QIVKGPSGSRLMHPTPKFGFDLSGWLEVRVLVGYNGHWQRPGETQARFIVHEPAFNIWSIERADLIAGVGFVGQRFIAVRKALGKIERALIILIQLHGDMLQVSGAFGA